MDFKVSVVMAVYNKEKYVSQAIDSIINQSMDFKKNIQIILVNDKSNLETRLILEDYQKRYPKNITLINNEKNMGPAYSRSVGLKHVKGEFVNFLDADDYMSKNAFQEAYSFLKSNYYVDIVSIPIHFFGVKRGPHNLNFKYEKNQIINVITDPQYIQLSGASAFFRFEELKKFDFNKNLRISEDSLLINQMLLHNPVIGFLKRPKYFYRKDGSQNSLITSSARSRHYFTSRIDEYFLNLIDYTKKELNKIPEFIQYVLMYDLQWILEIDFIDEVLTDDEIDTLKDNLIKILAYIDEDVILSQLSIPAHLKAHAILLKRHGWDYLNNNIEIQDNFGFNTVFIDNFDFKSKDQLYISGVFTNFTKDTEIIAEINNKEIPTESVNYPQRDNYSLNFRYAFNHNFKVFLDVKEGSKISFKTKNTNLKISYNQGSRLSKQSKYRVSKDNLAIDDNNEILVVKKSISKVLKLESKTLFSMLKNRNEGWRTGVIIRLFYLISHPILARRRIWLYMDLPHAAGDNGLELFKYVNTISDDNIRHYFVYDKSPLEDDASYFTSPIIQKIKRLLGLIPESKEYEEISKIGKTLPYRSLKHRLYTLYSEFIITSHPDNTIIYPFWGNYPFLSGLAKSKTVFLQHGVIKDDLSEWVNDYDKPLAMFLTSAEREADSFKDHDYGYPLDIIKTLGLPRFDSLSNNPQKYVVLMPSWRRQFEEINNNDFVKTNFYKVFNELLTDDDLLDFLKEEGYELVFKPHRNLHKFMDTFTKRPDVTFDTDLTNYAETFNTASLLITDYSSVFFDFSYMKKPVIYYHFDDGYHFDQDRSYFSYEKDGFGPVVATHEELKKDIADIIASGCQIDEKYSQRIDGFFKYHDRNNSKRVYEEILKLDSYY